jgi:hypothetical protein
MHLRVDRLEARGETDQGKTTKCKKSDDLLEDASTEIVDEKADPEELAEFIDVYLTS